MKEVFINAFGHVCEKHESKYKVVLQGSYTYSQLLKMYKYEVQSIEPKISLKYVLSKEIL
jgi:hypothetical protein